MPLLGDLPLVGEVLFENNVYVYLMYVLLPLTTWMLFRTRWGLRVRSVGEHPEAADTVGIDVRRTRYRSVVLGGMAAGLAGSFLTLGSTGTFVEDTTAGRGFIALAVMIFGRWNPMGALGGALLFGLAESLNSKLAILGSPIPSEFLSMTPYVVTLFVVAGFGGRARPPAADGQPYETASPDGHGLTTTDRQGRTKGERRDRCGLGRTPLHGPGHDRTFLRALLPGPGGCGRALRGRADRAGVQRRERIHRSSASAPR